MLAAWEDFSKLCCHKKGKVEVFTHEFRLVAREQLISWVLLHYLLCFLMLKNVNRNISNEEN